MGRQGGYTSKVAWVDPRAVKAGAGNPSSDRGGTEFGGGIEVFATVAGARDRLAELKGFKPPFGDGYDYLAGSAVPRLSNYLTPAQAAVYKAAFDRAAAMSASRIPATNSQAQAAPSNPVASPPAKQEGNISLAPSHMPPGPFKITPISGKAGKGLTFRYSNESNDLVGAPFVTVDFLDGSRVVGSNENFGTLKIGPGQNATDTAAPTSSQGQTMKFRSCEVMGYSLSAGEPVFAP